MLAMEEGVHQDYWECAYAFMDQARDLAGWPPINLTIYQVDLLELLKLLQVRAASSARVSTFQTAEPRSRRACSASLKNSPTLRVISPRARKDQSSTSVHGLEEKMHLQITAVRVGSLDNLRTLHASHQSEPHSRTVNLNQ